MAILELILQVILGITSLLLTLLIARPERSLHLTEEYTEAVLWIWQGLISFKCDALDLGIRSWSHPTDRISAVVFTLQQSLKYCLVSCRGPWSAPLSCGLTLGLVVGGYCFRRSCRGRDVCKYVVLVPRIRV